MDYCDSLWFPFSCSEHSWHKEAYWSLVRVANSCLKVLATLPQVGIETEDPFSTSVISLDGDEFQGTWCDYVHYLKES